MSSQSTPRTAAARRAATGLIALLAALTLCSCGGRPGQEGTTARSSTGAAGAAPAPKRLFLFAGAASQPATREATRLYTERTGIEVACTFGGSGAVLNQVSIEQFGDVYVPGSDDYMDIAEEAGHVLAETRRTVCYLLPVICVAEGNPLGISGLADLAAAGTKVTLGDPGSVCLGAIAVEALRQQGLYDTVRRNIVTYASDCQQVVNLIRLGEVDAAVGYDVFARQSPELLDALPLPGARRVHLPAAVIAYSKHPDQSRHLVDFLAGEAARAIYEKHGYTVTTD